MVKKLELTEDILKLISNIRFKEYNYDDETDRFSVDLSSLYGGNYVYEDVSYILGRYDEHIPGTEDNAMGPEFEPAFEDYMWTIHMFVVENLADIEDLVHQFTVRGGLQPGVYANRNGVWNLEK